MQILIPYMQEIGVIYKYVKHFVVLKNVIY